MKDTIIVFEMADKKVVPFEEVQDLLINIGKLQEENKKLVEALKFYANESYWEGREIDGDDWDDYYEDGNGIGGKLARQVLKEMG